MKKIYTILLSFISLSGAYAQTGAGVPFNANRPLFRPAAVPAKPVSESRAMYSFVVDYDYADSVTEVSVAGNLYDQRYAWDMNMHYVPTDTAIRYCTVVFDSIIDSYNLQPYDRSLLSSIMLDTLHVVIGQENNSGLDDTLIVKVMNVNANKIPGNTVLWSDTTIIPAGTPLGAEWLDFVVLSIPVGYSYPSTSTRIAVRLEYWGDKQDTAGFIAGFGYNGNCASGLEIAYATYMNPVGYNPNATAFPAGFSANSYIWFTPFNGGAQYPATNNYIYYPCDATSGYQPGSDAFNLWQNVLLYAAVTVDDAVGTRDLTGNGMTLFQNKPNPARNETTINYRLQKSSNVSIEIADLTGRIITTINDGFRPAGSYSTSVNVEKFATGTYFYTMKTDNGSLTNRMIINR